VRWIGRLERRGLVASALALLVVVYAGALRLDALTQKFGPVAGPAWLEAVQQRTSRLVSGLRPSGFTFAPEPYYPHPDGPPTRYISDPYTYLRFAREMQSFYAAHYREPVPVVVIRMFLSLLDDQDVAVSFASLFFSVLAVAATYWLGAVAFSRGVGLIAAFLMAIEYHLVSFGVAGGRDAPFLALVVLSALAMACYRRAPSGPRAVLLGATAAAACLVRMTSVSFLVPGFVFLLLVDERPWRARWRSMAVGLAVMLGLVGPYLVNCWLEFGDPLYSISYHADFYRQAAGLAVENRSGTLAYLADTFAARPFKTIDTVAQGLTSYPFGVKWSGFEPWVAGMGAGLAWASLAGLIAFTRSRDGRMLVLVLVTSLIPFSVTWQLFSNWGYTEHAYPFFLLAAAFALWHGGRAVTRPIRLIERLRTQKGIIRWGTAVAAGIGVAVFAGLYALPVLVFVETVHAGENAAIEAGHRDLAFFGRGWSSPVPQGAIVYRAANGWAPVIRLPLPAADDFDLRFRLDPLTPPAEGAPVSDVVVHVFANGRLLGRTRLEWDPERVGSYSVRLPKEVARAGLNRVELVSEHRASRPDAPEDPGDQPSGFKLWYVLVQPVVR